MNYGLKELKMDESKLQIAVLFREKELLIEKLKLIEKQIDIAITELEFKNDN